MQRPSRANVTIQNSTVPKGYTGCENECKIWWIQIQLNLAQNLGSIEFQYESLTVRQQRHESREVASLCSPFPPFVQISLFSHPEDFCSRYVGFVGGNVKLFFHNSRLVRAAAHLPNGAGWRRQIWTVVRAKAVPRRSFQVAILKEAS